VQPGQTLLISGAAGGVGSGVTPELIETDRRPAKVVSIADLPAPEYGAQVSAAPGDYLAASTGAALLAEQVLCPFRCRRPTPSTKPPMPTPPARRATSQDASS